MLTKLNLSKELKKNIYFDYLLLARYSEMSEQWKLDRILLKLTMLIWDCGFFLFVIIYAKVHSLSLS